MRRGAWGMGEDWDEGINVLEGCDYGSRRIPGAIAPKDVLQDKIWAALDPARRRSKRQKDLADIARLLEAHPDLKDRVPAEILAKLV